MFLDISREGVAVEVGRDTKVFEILDVDGPGTDVDCVVVTVCCLLSPMGVIDFARTPLSSRFFFAGTWISGGSEDGRSSPMLGFNGVRKGDLKGFWRVFAASFNRRRFACGVDIFSIE